jgi:hypothetical protein
MTVPRRKVFATFNPRTTSKRIEPEVSSLHEGDDLSRWTALKKFLAITISWTISDLQQVVI